MALIKCKECGSMISDSAEKCPKCGAPLENGKGSIPPYLKLLALVGIAFAVIGMISSNPTFVMICVLIGVFITVLNILSR